MKNKKVYRYETHLHTAPVSRCGRASAEETVQFYKSLGYDGIFITNHFLDGNINIPGDTPFKDKIDFYFSDYEKAAAEGEKVGLKVFCGVENSVGGTDFLIYGLGKDWFHKHPEYETIGKMSEKLALLRDNGALIIQAHPFREANYIDHIRLFPRCVEGVEIVNANRTDFENEMAALYAERYGLLRFAGSDNHSAGAQKKLAGVTCLRPIESVEDFMAAVRSGETEVFTLEHE